MDEDAVCIRQEMTWAEQRLTYRLSPTWCPEVGLRGKSVLSPSLERRYHDMGVMECSCSGGLREEVREETHVVAVVCGYNKTVLGAVPVCGI
jgi:hypothetical protein